MSGASTVGSRKIMLLGEIGVGKTSLVRRLVLGEFATEYRATIGVDVYEYTCPAGGDGRPSQSLILWDTDGDFGDSILEHVYCRGASAALVIADISRPPTVDYAFSLAEAFSLKFPGRPALVVFNKTDLVEGNMRHAVDAEIQRSAGRQACSIATAETSARTGKGVAATFDGFADIIHRRGL